MAQLGFGLKGVHCCRFLPGQDDAQERSKRGWMRMACGPEVQFVFI